MPAPIPVEGFALVGNLAGTGSATCPPQVRAYLKRYILAQLRDRSINVDALIDSDTTAVVMLEGTVPALASKGDHFDVRVSLIPGSETTSLRGGWLYEAELRPQGPGGPASRPLATAGGPTFVNFVDVAAPDLTSAYVLGGGRVSDEYSALITLPRADYPLASAIRNRLSERHGANVATAVSPRVVECTVPPDYRNRKARFIEMVAATFMQVTPELGQTRIERFVTQLASGVDRPRSEVALEAIGRESLGRLVPLLDSADEGTRLRAARVMLSLRDDRALLTLRQIALDPTSAYRLEAIAAVAATARRNDAVVLLRLLLRDADRAIVLAAYEHLRQIADPAVVQDFVGRSFYLERVVQTGHKAIFVARSGDPRIVIFGAPLACRDSVFVESPGGLVIVDARPGQGYMSLVRKNPARPGVIGPLKTGFVLSEVIRALGAEYTATEGGQLSGLGVSYAEVIALLEQMCAKGVVPAQFWPGPLPEFE
ncbi:MAG: flagellar basal body P-ring protein FlgI [Sedimentisphaerales bacterium]|nr:flagellar basal body P-ring protein FlgI [Sedimentisphaerales bacterium]